VVSYGDTKSLLWERLSVKEINKVILGVNYPFKTSLKHRGNRAFAFLDPKLLKELRHYVRLDYLFLKTILFLGLLP